MANWNSGDALKEEMEDGSRVGPDQGLEFVGQSGHHVEVVDGHQSFPARCQPLGLFEALALGTKPVAAEV
jgi:hypothetical protein